MKEISEPAVEEPENTATVEKEAEKELVEEKTEVSDEGKSEDIPVVQSAGFMHDSSEEKKEPAITGISWGAPVNKGGGE